MSKARYSIVRVDNNCPFVTEDMSHNICEKVFNCNEFWEDTPCSKKCNYGDTKEQLIKKVAQSLKNSLWNDTQSKTYEELAKEIVEFLGVEK